MKLPASSPACSVPRGRTATVVRPRVRPLGTEHAGLDAGSFIRLLTQVCYTEAELGTTIRQVHLMLSTAEELSRYEGFLGEIPHPSGV